MQQGDVRRLDREARKHARHQSDRVQDVLRYEELLDALLSQNEVEILFDEALGKLRELMRADAGTIFLLDEDGNHLYPRATQGLEQAVESGLRVPVGEGFVGKVFAMQQPLVLPDVTDDNMYGQLPGELGIKSVAGVPIYFGDQVTGVLAVASLEHRDFDQADTRLLELVALRVGMALERARLLHRERTLRERAERLSRFRTTLLHMASHDIKTPLMAMKVQLNLLQNDPGEARKYGALIDRNIDRLSLMLDDFLDLARKEAGRFVLNRKDVDLAAVVAEQVEWWRPQAESRGIALTARLEASVAFVDERRMMQVINNLLSNAVKNTAKGSIEVSVRPLEENVRITVEDTGRGMTREQVEHLFRAFDQGDAPPHEQGVGLGLHLSRALVQAHGGVIYGTSDGADQGSRFTVEVPRTALRKGVVSSAA